MNTAPLLTRQYTCPKCFSQVPVPSIYAGKEVKCLKCTKSFIAAPERLASEVFAKPVRKPLFSKGTKVFALIAVCFVIALCAVAKIIGGPTKEEAWKASQKFVMQRLKAPASAKFPTEEYQVAPTGERSFEVMGYVDSQNGFGAMLRSHFDASLVQTRDGEWMLMKLTLDDPDS